MVATIVHLSGTKFQIQQVTSKKIMMTKHLATPKRINEITSREGRGTQNGYFGRKEDRDSHRGDNESSGLVVTTKLIVAAKASRGAKVKFGHSRPIEVVAIPIK